MQKTSQSAQAAALRKSAEARLRKQKKKPQSPPASKSEVDSQRLLHELQVHHVELELQNTELQEARDRMEVLLEKYTDLYDFAPVGYFSLNEQGRITETNLTATVLLGVKRSQLINQPLQRFVSPASQSDYSAFLNKMFSDTGRHLCTAVLIKPNGGEFSARLIGNSAITLNGPHTCCRVALWDITSLVQAEAAQGRLAAIVESSDAAIIGKDLNGIITSWNKGAEQIFGYASREIVGSSVMRLIPSDRQAEEKSVLRRIKGGKSEQHFETLRQTKDGRLINVSVTLSPIKDAAGKVVGISKVARDISERKRTEEALRTSRELMTNIIDSTPSYIFATDRQHRYLLVNDAYARFLGRSAKKILGRTHHDFFPAAVADGFVKVNEGIMATGKLWQADETVQGVAMMTVKFPLRDVQGAVTGICGVTTDISKRKQAEDILRRNTALFSSLIQQAPVGVYVVDHQFRLQQMNLKARPVFRNVRPLIGRDFDEVMNTLWPKPVAAEIAGHFRHTLRTGKPYFSPEFSARRHDIAATEFYEWRLQRVTLPAGKQGGSAFLTTSPNASGSRKRGGGWPWRPPRTRSWKRKSSGGRRWRNL